VLRMPDERQMRVQDESEIAGHAVVCGLESGV